MSDVAEATEIRPAATVMVVRDGDGAGERTLQVLMLLRHPEAVFAPDAWVFPGGAVDPADSLTEVRGVTDEEASAALGLPSGGRAYFVAATRECSEEAGLVLDPAALRYVSRWITPPGRTRRFDTRFFLTPAPAGQVAAHDTTETVAAVWTSPSAALSRHAAGEINLVYPTIKHLQFLARHASVESALSPRRET